MALLFDMDLMAVITFAVCRSLSTVNGRALMLLEPAMFAFMYSANCFGRSSFPTVESNASFLARLCVLSCNDFDRCEVGSF